jgi:DNA-binding transcriptional MerR regulator
MMTRPGLSSLAIAVFLLWGAGPAVAETISVQDQEQIERLRMAQGFSAEEVHQLIEQVNKAGENGLPPEPLVNKVKEGLAKGVDPKRIDPVLRLMVGHFEAAQGVLQDAGNRGTLDLSAGNRQRALETMAEALARGVTSEEVRDLARVSQEGKLKVTSETLAAGAKSLAVIKEAKISSKDGTVLVSEGLRQGYRSSELVDLAREIKRRGPEFQEGRASIRALQEQMARGDRGDKLFRDSDHGGSGRGDRMERSGGGDRGDRGDRGGSGDRGDRGDRSGRGGRDR